MSFKTLTLLALCMMMASIGAACGDDGDSGGTSGMGGDGDCDGEDVPSYVALAAFQTCTMCHASDKTGAERNGAPADHDFDTYEGALEHLDQIVEEVEQGKMPPPNSGLTITAEQRKGLLLWARCGTPESP